MGPGHCLHDGALYAVFFAGIVFVSSFARAHFQGRALGSNLFGSLAGGWPESVSLWFGLKLLIVLAAIIYAGSALSLLLRTTYPSFVYHHPHSLNQLAWRTN